MVMTQEQKVRTRDEQVSILLREFGGAIYADGLRYMTNMKDADLLRAITEAETRGAAEAAANVAALEARVKELEGALKEAASALEQVKDGERGGYNARNGKFVSLQMSDGERADIIHSDVTAECEGALETARAALTREGGV